MNRKALGKGINALIPDFEEGIVSSQAHPLELLVEEISPNRLQPRKFFDDEKFEELVNSIRETGVIQPVIVQKSGKGYELVAGERRWRASCKVGLKKIPVIIRDFTDTQSLEVALIENIHRQDLNPMEEAEAFVRLADEFGLTQEKIAQRVGKNRVTVANTMRLVKLPRPVKEDMIAGRLTMGHARALLALETPKEIEMLRQEIVKKGLNVRQAEARVSRLKQGNTPVVKKEPVQDIFLKDVERDLERKLGTKVSIAPGGKGGKLIINYYSDDDLERITALIGGKKG